LKAGNKIQESLGNCKTMGKKKGWGRNLSPFKPYPNYENLKNFNLKGQIWFSSKNNPLYKGDSMFRR